MERRHCDPELSVRRHDVVVVGAGVAGMSVALGLPGRQVALLTCARFAAGGSSPLAQGGVAVAWAEDDSPRLHAEDTFAAGAGLSQAGVVGSLTAAAPAVLDRIMSLGARFDRTTEGALVLGREGAHSRARIVHAGGDATGAELVRALGASLRAQQGVEIFEAASALDLALVGDDVVGVVARHGSDRVLHLGRVVLATGGFGQLYRFTTNPREARGDGLALAFRAGAVVGDLEFVQFHPTALRVAMDPLPLVTEALRGAGAWLVDEADRRFMPAEHPAAELAPRDVVARAIWRCQRQGRTVALDARRSVGEAFPDRFPSVYAACRAAGIDPCTQPIPVTPAAHYAMGGVATDADGRTSLRGLWACGEVACTGVHGANRLASNSLLEALVFGWQVARDLDGSAVPRAVTAARVEVCREGRQPTRRKAGVGELRERMWDEAGLVRSGAGLARLGDWLATHVPDDPSVANLWTVGRLVVAAAAAREESRGAHFREDHPLPREEWRRRGFWRCAPGRGFALRPASPPESVRREIA